MALSRPDPRKAVRALGSLVLIIAAGAASAADPDLEKLKGREAPEAGPIWRLGDPTPRSGGFDSQGITLLSQIPLSNFPNVNRASGNDCWGYVSPSGREYAIMGLEGGFGYVEITDPTNPQVIATIPGPNSLWHDVKVVGHYAYGVSEGGSGIQIMNLANIDNGQVTLVRNWTSGGYTTTHNIVVNEDAGSLWIVGANIGNGGLVHINITNPEQPVLNGGWTQMYVHDAQVVTWDNGPLAGRQIAFLASGFDGGFTNTALRVVDVTNPTSPQFLASATYPNARYAHQLWLSEDRRFLYLNDELDEGNSVSVTTTRIFNVENPADPTFVGTFTTGLPAVDHNLYTHNGLIFQANYRSGLRVFDALDPLNPVEVAYLDTYPGSDSAQFNGAWSSYPYFPSGTVIVSDIERGLFVTRVDAPLTPAAISLDNGLPAIISPAGGTELTVRAIARSGANPVSGVKIMVDTGSGFMPYPATLNPDGTWTALTPSALCDTTVQAYFIATVDDGQTVTYPLGAPAQTIGFDVADQAVTVFADNFNSNLGWTVGAPDDDATAGIWTRVNPVGTTSNGAQVQPDAPFVGSACYVTGQHTGGGAGTNDVDNGKTTLFSPTLNLSGRNESTAISYWRWFSNSAGANPFNDVFVVDISADNGQTWVNVETVGPTGPEVSGGWFQHRFHPSDLIPMTDQVKLRFVASDENPQALIEAGVDGFLIETLECENPAGCSTADLAEPFGTVNVFDLFAYLGLYAAQEPSADLAEPFGTINVFDLFSYLERYAQGCP